MRKALLFVAGVLATIALVIWVASWFRAEDAVAAAAAKPWPGGLGRLDSVGRRYPPLHANEAAKKLTALGSAFANDKAVEDFVRREITRGQMTIGNPPALRDVSAMRDLLLGPQVVWESGDRVSDNESSTSRALQMSVARALVASALTRARGNDPEAWEDLHAVWNLARALDPYPQLTLRTASLSMTRMVNGVAWKMPLPAPSWLGEMQERDYVQPLVVAFQYEVASNWAHAVRIFPTKWLAESIERDRRLSGELLKRTQCDVNAPNLSFVWRRAFRYRAEREATANALRVREGKPIRSASRCSDGSWTFDGATLRFAREIPTAAPDIPMPLVLRVTP